MQEHIYFNAQLSDFSNPLPLFHLFSLFLLSLPPLPLLTLSTLSSSPSYFPPPISSLLSSPDSVPSSISSHSLHLLPPSLPFPTPHLSKICWLAWRRTARNFPFTCQSCWSLRCMLHPAQFITYCIARFSEFIFMP